MKSVERSDVLVAGGGIAGLAASVRLAEEGLSVVLLETRKKLGGRATSFVDSRSGRVLDNCQHVVLGCCTNYLDLLSRLGATDKVRWTRKQYWIEEGGRVSVIGPGLLPAPAHFTGSMMGAGFLRLSEKVQVARACSSILRLDRRAWRGRTFTDFLVSCGQSDRVVRRFWAPVVVSACNLDVSRVCAASALHVFQEGFLAAGNAADIGVPAVPLVELYARAAEVIARAGGKIELGAGVERLDESSATTTDGRRFEADRVVCAVPVERVNRVVDESVRGGDDRFALLDRFTHSPILGVHLTFDRPVMPRDRWGGARGSSEGPIPHAVLVDRPTQWLFTKDVEGRYLHAVISAADDWVGLSEGEIGRRVLSDIHACMPESRAAELAEVRAVKEKLATWAPTPGIEAMRPSAAGKSRIVLAGDYTDTGWPATMEGAARSGYAAAAAVLGREAGSVVRPPARIAPLARVLGLRAG